MTTQPTDMTQILQAGIEAARAGQRQTAQKYLVAVLKQDSNNIPALFWLAYVASSPQHSLQLLNRILALDPDNERAKTGLRWAKKRLETEAASTPPNAAPPPTGQTAPELPDEFIRQQLLSRQKIMRQAKKGAQAHRARRTIDPLLAVVVVLGAVALLTAGIWGLALVPPETLAAWLPAATEQPPEVDVQKISAPATAQSLAAAATTAPARHFSSAGDTILSTLPVAVEAEAPISTPSVATELPPAAISPAPESEPAPNEATAPAEANQPDSPGTAVDPQNDPTLSQPLSAFIGPAEAVLDGPRLFEPVDESLLAHTPDSPDEKWIEVNVTTQRVTAWEGNVPVMSFISSTGLPGTPTVLGNYNIYWKLTSTLMAGADYYLPDVPYTMYFYGGYALHGTYWHDNFGQPMSHGCVNLKTDHAKQLFEWADPVLPPGQSQVISTFDSPGTLVVVHE